MKRPNLLNLLAPGREEEIDLTNLWREVDKLQPARLGLILRHIFSRNGERRTLRVEVARIFGVSTTRINQIEENAIRKLTVFRIKRRYLYMPVRLHQIAVGHYKIQFTRP